MVKKQQLTPIPPHVKITRCPPGRARWAELPGEYSGGSEYFRVEQVDTYYRMVWGR